MNNIDSILKIGSRIKNRKLYYIITNIIRGEETIYLLKTEGTKKEFALYSYDIKNCIEKANWIILPYTELSKILYV